MIEVIVGIISGIITSMGMGGGSILILLLTIFLNYEQQIAQGLNLLFFIPSSIVSIIAYIKAKKINFKLALILTISGVIGAIIGAKIANLIQTEQLKKWFGIFLLFIAIHEIYSFYNQYINKQKRHNSIKKG